MKHWFSDVASFRRDTLGFLLNRGCAATRPLERLALGPKPVWLVADPELIKPILKAPESRIDKGRFIRTLRKVLNESSLTMSGEEHRKRREVLHGTFARGGVTRLIPELSSTVRATVAQLAREKSFDAHGVMAPLSLRMASIVMFGRAVLSKGDEQALIDAVSTVESDLADEVFRVLPLMPWQKRRRAQARKLAREAMDLVVKRVKERASSSSAVAGLTKLGLTDEQLSDEILTMILAGYHTTGSSAAWLIYFLATQPEHAAAIAREAADITDGGGEIRPERLVHAGKSMAFAREVLRLYPSSHWFSRDVQANIEIGGERLRRGDAILISPWHMHRDPRYWEAPDEFNPDRDFVGSSAFIPFGAGPRACVGMGLVMVELQLMALEFASAFDVKLMSSEPVGAPRPAITLLPPPIELALQIRGAIPCSKRMAA